MQGAQHDPQTRRRFLAGLGAASVVLVATACQPVPGLPTVPVGGDGGDGGGGATTVPATSAPARVDDPLLAASWAPLVGTGVVLGSATGSVRAILDEVVPGPSGGPRSFRLAFRSEASSANVDHIETVTDPAGTPHRLDVFPADRGIDHHWYVAVIAAD